MALPFAAHIGRCFTHRVRGCWECITDDLLDGLTPDALRAVQQLAKELEMNDTLNPACWSG